MTPREQILATAARLFFEQGYTQTGINQLIDESEVARRTFYHHFASKEELAAVYLEIAAGAWLEGLRACAVGCRTATGVVRALFDHVEAFAHDTEFRGCGMLNMAAEFADAESPMRVRVREYKQAQRTLIRELLAPLGVGGATADQVHVLLEGAIAAAAAHVDSWPIQRASRAAQTLVSMTSHDQE
jgi:AcrR family transcriptional regulator